jgi:N-acetylmuramoyl-L-alanine amidase
MLWGGWNWVAILGVAALLAGCGTSGSSGERFANPRPAQGASVPPLPSLDALAGRSPGSVAPGQRAPVSPARTTAEPTRLPEPARPVPVAVEKPAEPVAAPAAASVALPMVNGEWVDYGAWLQSIGWSLPHPVPVGREVRIETDGPAGAFAVMPGQKKAWWNGMQVWLGFEPRMERGRLLVHRLDVEKHCRPIFEGGGAPAPLVRTVVIDAGHGGRNPGTRSIAGNRFEKELTLDWAIRLRALLEARGWRVTMTRTNDVDLSLAERVDISEASGAALFVSLHFNSAFPNRDAAGLEVYSLTPQGMASHVVREYPDEPGRAFPNNAFDVENLRWAARVHRSMLGTTGLADRGVRRARFLDVVRWQGRPAILVEGGYLSNPQEAARIQTPEFRQKLAAAVAAALD